MNPVIKSKPSNNQTNVQDLMGICSLISLCDKKQVGCQGGISELVFDGLDSRKAKNLLRMFRFEKME